MVEIISCISFALFFPATLNESLYAQKVLSVILQAIYSGVCFFCLRKKKKVMCSFYHDPSTIECIAHLLFVAAEIVFFEGQAIVRHHAE